MLNDICPKRGDDAIGNANPAITEGLNLRNGHKSLFAQELVRFCHNGKDISDLAIRV
jgi:hypothetical protein